MRKVFFLLAILLFACAGCIAGSAKSGTAGHATVTFHTQNGNWNVSAEIADNDYLRSRGLMYRNYLGEGKGMLFTYPYPGTQAFWMKNTPIHLDIIYIDSAGVVQKVRHDFAPCKADPCEKDVSPQNTLHVVEVPGGWSKKYGVEAGAEATITT